MRATKRNFKQYVHEFVDSRGTTRYAVCDWDEEHAQFTRPMDAGERALTGCHTYFGKTPADLGGYTSRRAALRRARYLYGDREAEASQEE